MLRIGIRNNSQSKIKNKDKEQEGYRDEDWKNISALKLTLVTFLMISRHVRINTPHVRRIFESSLTYQEEIT